MNKKYTAMGRDKQETGNNTLKRIEVFLFNKYELRINIISNDIEAREKGTKDTFKPIDLDLLAYDLLDKGYISHEKYLKAIMACKVEKYDPFFEYFESLGEYKPEQEPDYINQLCNFIDTDDNDFFKVIFKKFLVWTVVQALGNIEFNKMCLTLIGKQNDGKTTFINFLVPEKLKGYYKTGYDFEGKEGLISLTQNFIINLDELASFTKRDINDKFKSILSSSKIRYRPLYQSKETTINRRATFVASTNQYEFLTDETGNVRWLIFVVKNIIHDNGKEKGYNKNIDINNIWKQAYYLFKSGFQYHLTIEEQKKQKTRNLNFMKTNDETSYILEYVQKSNEENYKDLEFLTTTQITDKLKILTGNNKINSNNVGKALTLLEYPRHTKRAGEKSTPIKGYLVKFKNNL